MPSSIHDGDDDENKNNNFSFQTSACFSMMAFSNDDESDDEVQAEQDSLAASNALVGENLLDSPAPKQRLMKRGYNNNNNLCLPPPPPIPLATSGSTINRHGNGGGGNDVSVGIMAHGLAWVQRTRESRRRRYLQHQAEQQLLKLKKAQEDEDTEEEPYVNRSLFQNSTFQSIMSVPGAVNSANSQHAPHLNHQTSSSLQESGGEGSRSRRNMHDLSDRSEDMDMGAVVSQSGSGYSFNLPLHADMEEEAADFIPPVRVEDEPDIDVQAPFVLSQTEMQQIAKHVLPTGIAYCKWTRLYSLVRDGDSFDACLRLVQDHTKTLMVVRTSRNQIMGGFADMAWRVESGGASYFGGPESCLFKFIPAEGSNRKSAVKAFKWTGANRYIQLCDNARKMLAFGGGGEEGAFGLSVEQDFLLGSTGSCATFGNEPLCDHDTFEIVDLEIYGFLIGQF